MRWALLAALLLLAGCKDPRCHQDKFYCLSGAEAEAYLDHASDRQLIDLAVLDEQTSRPPSGHFVYEMARRGPDRAKAILYTYAQGSVDENVIDAMVRTFSDLGEVCGEWDRTAPKPAVANLRAACKRVFSSDDMAALRKSADATFNLR